MIFTIFIILILKTNAFAQQVIKNDFAMLLENERNSISIFQNVAEAIVNVTNLIKFKNIISLDEGEIQTGQTPNWRIYVITN